MNKKKIHKELSKRGERVYLEVCLDNYDGYNVYVGLIYNKKINKYRVLYIPLDLVDNNRLDDYGCYQFLSFGSAEYIMSLFNDNEEYSLSTNRNRKLENSNSQNIYISVYLNNNYEFMFTDYIDKDFEYLFDSIVTLFDYTPLYTRELSLSVLRGIRSPYNLLKCSEVLDIELMYTPYKDIFSEDIIKNERYNYNDINGLEYVNGLYYAVVNNKKYIIKEDLDNGIVKIYGSNRFNSDEGYIILKAIRNKKSIEFSIIEVSDEFSIKRNLYVYGLDNNGNFLSVQDLTSKSIKVDDIKKKNAKIIRSNKYLRELINIK